MAQVGQHLQTLFHLLVSGHESRHQLGQLEDISDGTMTVTSAMTDDMNLNYNLTQTQTIPKHARGAWRRVHH